MSLRLGKLALIEDALRSSKELLESLGKERRFGLCWCKEESSEDDECYKEPFCLRIKDTIVDIEGLLEGF